ncbi:MAG: hypothetical protein IKN15_12560 [Bacteroidaceae bacterium]|nr:hypothetical protein [Bacteroidaceae bacterium]
MRKGFYIVGVLLLLLAACTGDKEVRAVLDRAEAVMESCPDSAYAELQTLFDGNQESPSLGGVRGGPRTILLLADATNKLYKQMPSDTVFQEVVDYYDRHGNANERMKSYYLMGCIYRDRHEAPMALQWYLDAVEQADTLDADCDYLTLMRIYGQMADVYHSQVMPMEEISANKQYSRCAAKTDRTYDYIRGIELQLNAYHLLSDTAKILTLTDSVHDLYLQAGMPQAAASVYPTAINLYLQISAMTAWADVEINETNFPDENFRNYLLSDEYGYGKDGVLTDSEIAYIQVVNVRNKNIQSLKGIEFFTALKRLQCDFNQLTSLDLSKNTALRELDCSENYSLTMLDLSNNTELIYLNCSGSILTSLDLSKNTKLTYLNCSGNPQMKELNISGCDKLTEFMCMGTQIKELDLSSNISLKKLYIYDNQLTTLDVSNNTALEILQCDGNQLAELDVSKCTKLTLLSCTSNLLRTLDVSNNKSLKNLYCYGNQLKTLDVSQNTTLTVLYCYNNKLKALDLSQNTELNDLRLYSNQIKGAGMDALVKSLPTVSWGRLDVMYFENEQNEMTTTQVATAKAKGWNPYCYINDNFWMEYAGSEPEPIVIAEETTVNPSENAEPGQATTTESGVTTSLGTEDVVDATEGSVTMTSSMTTESVKELIETTRPGSTYFAEQFKGFYFLLAAGKGKVEFDIETTGGYSLGVMKGSEFVGLFTQTTKGTVTIPYDLEEDTWFFAYPVVNTPAAANRAPGECALKVYGLRIIPETQPDGINNLTPAFAKGNGTVYNLQGQRINGLQKGLNIVDGMKIMVK